MKNTTVSDKVRDLAERWENRTDLSQDAKELLQEVKERFL